MEEGFILKHTFRDTMYHVRIGLVAGVQGNWSHGLHNQEEESRVAMSNASTHQAPSPKNSTVF